MREFNSTDAGYVCRSPQPLGNTPLLFGPTRLIRALLSQGSTSV